MTIKDAIKAVLLKQGRPLTIQEIYESIVTDGLYEFGAANPKGVVSVELRRYCLGVSFSSAAKTKHFRLIDDNKYYVLDIPQVINNFTPESKEYSSHISTDLLSAHENHLVSFKRNVLEKIKSISPQNFEIFTSNLMRAYGFENVEVTDYSKDGGIDGFGQLKAGFGHIKVAFQCKRYSANNVRSKEIQEFRGAIQGKCEQGIFFTTSKFANGCEKLMFQGGAVPIILIDGECIVDIMIERQFGVQVDSLPIYQNAFDLALLE